MLWYVCFAWWDGFVFLLCSLCLLLLIKTTFQLSSPFLETVFKGCWQGFFSPPQFCALATLMNTPTRGINQIWLLQVRKPNYLEKCKNSSIFWQPVRTCCLDMTIPESNSLEVWWCWHIFFHKNPFYWIVSLRHHGEKNHQNLLWKKKILSFGLPFLFSFSFYLFMLVQCCQTF